VAYRSTNWRRRPVEPTQILDRVHIVQRAQQCDPPSGKVCQRVGQRVLGRPAHCGERTRWPARRHRHKPIAAICRRTERRIRDAQRAECGERILRPSVGNVATHQRNAGAREAKECAVHSRAEITCALSHAIHRHRQAQPCAFRGNRQHRMEATFADQRAQQPDQCRQMEP